MLIKYSERDLNILALTVFGEARGEPREGKVGVAWSAVNRALADLWNDDRDDWWGEGVAGVCLRSWQYSCWNESKGHQGQRHELVAFLVGNDLGRGILKPSARANADLEACWQVARAVLDGREPDPTAGSTHYYNPRYAGQSTPSWAKGKSPAARLGAHLFFNDVEDGYRPPVATPSTPAPVEAGDGIGTHVLAIRAHLDAIETITEGS